ncbi:MAG: hypothetical protein CL878_03240 [Dehalococcoidia bacterium]|nr:hypothetical protein [Dehalococcoidia bacterium]
MGAFQVVRAIGPIDVKSVGRDSLLRWVLLLPLLLGAAVRWVLPDVVGSVGDLIQIELLSYLPIVLSYALLLLTPIMAGVLIGFLLLDQRDDHTLTAIQVTPLPMRNYLAYRLAVPMLLSLLLTLGVFPLAGLMDVGWVPLLLASLVATPLAPIFALTLAAFAENKVQGFALMKALGVLYFPPLIAYFVPAPWQWAFGIMPNFWPAQLYWLAQAGDPNYWISLPIGLAYQAILLVLLVRRFNVVMHR